MKSIFYKNFSVSYSIAITTIFFIIGLTSLASNFIFKETNNQDSYVSQVHNSCQYNVKRIDGFNLVKPIMLVDEECESHNLLQIKNFFLILIKRAGLLKKLKY